MNVTEVDVTQYDRIFVPNRYERHIDHACVYGIFQKMLKAQKSTAKLFEYEVWSPLTTPGYVLDCTDIINQKLELVRVYQSQTKYTDYVSMTLGLGQYRGAGFRLKYAEVYHLEQSVCFWRKIYHMFPAGLRKAVKKLLFRS